MKGEKMKTPAELQLAKIQAQLKRLVLELILEAVESLPAQPPDEKEIIHLVDEDRF